MLVDMASKTTQESPTMGGEAPQKVDKPTENQPKTSDTLNNQAKSANIMNNQAKPADIMNQAKPAPLPPSPAPAQVSVSGFMKLEPNDPYRRLLPAVLFVLTFVTVMSMLLIYMDNVASVQQFRLNMSREQELARIPQGSAALVAYVRQLHLAPRPPREPLPPPQRTPSVLVLERLLGPITNGTYVEYAPAGPRSASTRWLEAAGWRGVCVRAAARDFLALRTQAAALHACLSASAHPREEAEAEAAFRSRVLCLPLYTVLLAARALPAHYVLLAGAAALPALAHVPYRLATLQVIEVVSSDPVYRNNTTNFLLTKNYTIAATFPESIMYVLKNVTEHTD